MGSTTSITTTSTTTIPTTTTTGTTSTILTTTPAAECPITCPPYNPPDDLCNPVFCVLEDNLWYCKTIPKHCNDLNPCTDDSCNATTGLCVFDWVPERTNCSCASRDPPCPTGSPCNPGLCRDMNETSRIFPECFSIPPEEVCNDGNPCTDNYCLEGNQTIPGDCNFTFFGNYTCANCFNPNIPGCVPGGL